MSGRSLKFVAAVVLVGCGSGVAAPNATTQPSTEEQLRRVQVQACIRPAKRATCEPDRRVEWLGQRIRDDAPGAETLQPRMTLWCEAGQPTARFEDGSTAGRVEGPIPQSVWESVWRVLDVTSSCVSLDRTPVRVTRDGATVPCVAPTFEVRELIGIAHRAAKQGPPSRSTKDVPDLSSICSIDPDACKVSNAHVGPCPPIEGDLWSGLRREPPPAATTEPTRDPGEAAEEAFTDPGDPADLPDKPPPSAVTRMLNAHLAAARACVRGESTPTRVRFTFASEGYLSSTALEGTTDTTRSACIGRAFSGARVPPFQAPSYEVRVVLRGEWAQ